MSAALQKLEDGTIQLTITIPSDKVKKTRELVIEEMVKQVNLPGFRKGKAPKKMVEEKLDQARVREEMLRKLLPEAYIQAVQDHKIRPMINPRIHIGKVEDPSAGSGQGDWEFTAITCERPEIELGKYKEAIAKITAKSKIVVPGKENKEASFDDIVKALLENAKGKIPQILKDQEVERLLAGLLDDVKRLGLTLDQYLSSTGKNPETLRAEYEKKVEGDLLLEFALQKVAEEEKIQVEEKEIDEAIAKAKDDAERKSLESNRYLLASIIRQQKTLDFLRNL